MGQYSFRAALECSTLDSGGTFTTLEEGKIEAAKILANLIHYPVKRRQHYPDDVTTIAIALVKASSSDAVRLS